ncbi:MAG: surface-adhesin E family protein [Nostoc sp.]|uniref:surface-adhesin E family protein n=1 Tax=Nostoc sp. TaxID=1180 RepID=UPI002FF7A48E
MKSLFLGLLITASAVLPATATEWVHVSINENNATLSVDTESITQINGGYAYKALVISQEHNKYMVTYNQMLCRERMNRLAGYESYTVDGRLLESHELPNSSFDSITVDSMNAVLWEKLCH